GKDVAHDVTDFIERAGEQSFRGALTQRERHVAHMIPRAAGEECPQRVDHRLLETGDGRHGGEPQRQAVEVALGKQADGRKGGEKQQERRRRLSHPEGWARCNTTLKRVLVRVLLHSVVPGPPFRVGTNVATPYTPLPTDHTRPSPTLTEGWSAATNAEPLAESRTGFSGTPSRANSTTTCGSNRCSTSSTRAASVS